MIVKMKKASMIVLESEKQSSLEKLRKIGVLHLEDKAVSNEELDKLIDHQNVMERSLLLIPAPDKKAKPNEIDKEADPLEKAINILELIEEIKTEKEEIERLKREAEKLDRWGDYEPEDILTLKEKGVDIRLYEITKDKFDKLDDTGNVFKIYEGKNFIRTAIVNPDSKISENLPDSIPLPDRSLNKVKARIATREYDIDKMNEKLRKLSKFRETIEYGIEQIGETIKFAIAKGSMEVDDKIAYLTGFVPVNKSDKLEKAAARNGWVVMVTDPGEDDIPPTLVENPALVKAINPVFNLLGTVPGYKEFDISIWFLMFFSVFWAMILGDAGYGLIFLGLTIIGRLAFKKAPYEAFLLLLITSLTTITWGAITGNWFGAEAIAQSASFKWMVIPEIASFASMAKGNVNNLIIFMCFILGVVHLTVAHVMSFFRSLPSIKAFSEIGWLGVLWGLFLLIINMILKIEVVSKTDGLLICAASLVVVLIFIEQKGNFLQGLKEGFNPVNVIMNLLGSIGFFADIVSYVRLFAVGLATLAVAESFNGMAAAGVTSGNIVQILIGALILFFGHTLNIVLGCMSLIVHGVRLNMLEFSGHLNMEWTGVEYDPFKKNEA